MSQHVKINAYAPFSKSQICVIPIKENKLLSFTGLSKDYLGQSFSANGIIRFC